MHRKKGLSHRLFQKEKQTTILQNLRTITQNLPTFSTDSTTYIHHHRILLLIRKKKSFLLLRNGLYIMSLGGKKRFRGKLWEGEWVKVASKEQTMPCPDRATRGATKHKSSLGEETPFLREKNYLGRKNRISFRTWQKTFYFCTLKYHALIAPLRASAHPSDPICHTSSLRFRAPPCCFSLPAL